MMCAHGTCHVLRGKVKEDLFIFELPGTPGTGYRSQHPRQLYTHLFCHLSQLSISVILQHSSCLNVPSCHLPTGHFCFLPHFQRVLFICFFIVHLHSPSLHLPPAPRGSNNAKSQHNDKWSDGNCGAGNAKFPPLATNVASISSFVYVSNTAMGTKRSAVNQM